MSSARIFIRGGYVTLHYPDHGSRTVDSWDDALATLYQSVPTGGTVSVDHPAALRHPPTPSSPPGDCTSPSCPSSRPQPTA
jgi:hypothetical protein